MDIQTKYLIIEKLIQTQDDSILERVKDLLGVKQDDWWDEISEAEKASVQKGIAELDRGEGISHEEVMKKAGERFF